MTAMEWADKLADLKAAIQSVSTAVSPLESHLDEVIDELRAVPDGALAQAIAGVAC